MIGKIVGGAATTLLVVAALLLACWFAFSAVSGAALVTFRTGSMAPAMPQGALAVTVPVQAAELEVGEVVTVQRVGEPMPVTHRIVEIGEPGAPADDTADLRAGAPGSAPPDVEDPGMRRLVLQGDDNASPDFQPYLVADARRVVFSMPYAGGTVMLLQSPIGMGALILLVGAFTTWAFWPKRGEAPAEDRRSRAAHGEAAHAGAPQERAR